jgi:DUF4097 and DUF4098 domain-containing protein YvlB
MRIIIYRKERWLTERHPPQTLMMRLEKIAATTIVLLTCSLLSGCISEPSVKGTFDRSFTVNGPVSLDMTAGSGDVHVTAGAAGEVRIHGEIEASHWGLEDGRKRVDEVKSNPPVSQEGNLIRVSSSKQNSHNVSIDYTIEVPAETEVHCVSGSGDVEVVGINGPVDFSSGSGDLTAKSIASDIQTKTGSGDIDFEDVKGQVQVSTGSGDIKIHSAKGGIRLNTSSGDIEISQPGQGVVANTGSGGVEVNGATSDLRLHTGSGDITVDGNPGAANYWDLHASSGDVKLHVPSSASFRLFAHTGSGDLDAQIPIVMEGTVAKHELRARVGDGKARVEIETSSGSIELH